MAEFALVLPILMIVLLGAVDFGRLMFARVTAEAATRAGASWGAGILANATQALDPVFALSTSKCGYGPTCNIEARACSEATGFPGYSGGLTYTGAGQNPVSYQDCAKNYAASTNSAGGVCTTSASQSNPFLSVKWWRWDGSEFTEFTPTPLAPARTGDEIEVDGTWCFKTLIPWPAVPRQIILTTNSVYTIQQ